MPSDLENFDIFLYLAVIYCAIADITAAWSTDSFQNGPLAILITQSILKHIPTRNQILPYLLAINMLGSNRISINWQGKFV